MVSKEECLQFLLETMNEGMAQMADCSMSRQHDKITSCNANATDVFNMSYNIKITNIYVCYSKWQSDNTQYLPMIYSRLQLDLATELN